MITITLDEFRKLLKAQGVPIEQVKFVCPVCKTVQCGQDLIDAGVGNNFDEIEKYLAFSCIGRFDSSKGCDWTLGGLFQLHELTVTTDDGEKHPRFRPVNLEMPERGNDETPKN